MFQPIMMTRFLLSCSSRLCVLEQKLLHLVQGSPTCEGIQEYKVLPLIVPVGGSPYWTCPDTKYTVMPDDRVFGHIVRPVGFERLKIVSVAGPK